jgi:hypothetical protein
MDFKKFQPSKNNPNIYYDTTFDDNRREKLYSILQDGNPNINQCGTVYYKCDRKHFGMCAIGDLHTDEMVYDRWSAVREYCHNTNLNLCYLGDLSTVSVNNYGNCQPQESRFNVQEEMYLTRREIGYNANKTLGGVGGNHDEPQQGDRLKNVYISAAGEVLLSNNVPYSPNAMLYVIDLPVYKNKKFLYYKPAYILTIHGHGRTPSERIESASKIYDQGMGVIKEYNRLHGTNIVPDFIFGGHFHGNSSCDFSVDCNIVNANGKVLGSYLKTVRVRECSTFASKQSSSFNNSFEDTIVQNLNVVDMRYKHNDSFDDHATNDNPEDILEIIEFPILKRNSCEYTTPAVIYNEHNKDFDLRKSVSKKQLNELVNEL